MELQWNLGLCPVALGYFFSDLVKRHPFHLGFMAVNDFSAPFLLVSILTGFSVIIAGIYLPESSPDKKATSALPPGIKTPSGPKTIIKNSIAVYLPLSLVSQFALSLFEGTFVLHAHLGMNFNVTQLGAMFMVCGFVMAAAQGTAVAGFIEKFGAGKILPLGFIFMGIALVMLMVVSSINQILIFVAILAVGMAIITPSIAVLISSRAEE